MLERRTSKLGRTVPGMSPRTQRKLKQSLAVTQRISSRLAGRLALELFLTPPRRKTDAVDIPVVELAQRGSVEVHGHRVATYEWGDTGPLVLMLHGWGSHAARFGSFVGPLCAAGYRVIAADAPGHGASAGRQSNLPEFRDTLRAVIATHGPVESLIAHSLGAGACLILLAGTNPVEVRSLVALGVPRDIDYVLDSFAEMIGLGPRANTAFRTAFTERFGLKPSDFSATQLALLVTVPTMVVHDRADEIAPYEHGEELAANLPHSILHTTTGLGHSGPLRDPATIDAIVAFLRGRTKSSPA